MGGIEFRGVTGTLDDKLLNDMYTVVKAVHKDDPDAKATLKGYNPDKFRKWANPIYSVFAYDGEKPVGVGFLEHRKWDNVQSKAEGGYLFGFRVNPDYQKRGIGRTIAEMRIDYAKKIGIKVIRGNASDDSFGMLQKLGFAGLNREWDEGSRKYLHIVELNLK